MITLIKNIGKIYSADTDGAYGQYHEFRNCAILLEDEIIRHIYTEPDPDKQNADLIIDGDGRTLLPGFVDAHTHPVFWNTRESEFIMRIKGMSYEEIAAAGGGIRLDPGPHGELPGCSAVGDRGDAACGCLRGQPGGVPAANGEED